MTNLCGVLILNLNHCRLERPAHVIGLVQKFLSEKLKVWAMVTFLSVNVINLLDKMDVSGDGDVVTNHNDHGQGGRGGHRGGVQGGRGYKATGCEDQVDP